MKKQKSKLKYVKRDIIHRIMASYVVLIGERSNGKSHAVKEDVIKNNLESGEEFAYIRRWKEDTKNYMIESYFADILCDKNTNENLLETWSNGKYNDIVVDKGTIYLATSKDGIISKGQILGHVFALNWAEHYKSLSFPKITTAVFEEFCTQGSFLQDEPNKMQHLISTIFRHSQAKVYMVGNTVSRINPYFAQWQLTNINKQKNGTIENYYYTYDNDGEKCETKIAVYLTHSLNFNSGMFFGNISKAIAGGEWETSEQPHLPGEYSEYKKLYTVVFMYDYTLFLMEFLQDPNNASNFTWYISPKNTPPQKKTRVVSNKYALNYLWTKGFIGLTDAEVKLFRLLEAGKVCFMDNLTGTEFYQCYNMM